MEQQELAYGAASFVAVMKPVLLCMILASIFVVQFRTQQVTSQLSRGLR